jgi:K+-sensing histidine kinase KdpD
MVLLFIGDCQSFAGIKFSQRVAVSRTSCTMAKQSAVLAFCRITRMTENSEDLEDENARLRRELKRLQDCTMQSCHELRFNVSTAASYTKLLGKRGTALEPEVHAEAIAQIEEHLEVSTQLIMDLLRQALPGET